MQGKLFVRADRRMGVRIVLHPIAAMSHSQARSLILAGKKDEGKKVLDLFITENAGTRWAAYADELIKAKNRLVLPSAPAAADLSTFFSAEAPEQSTNATDTVKTTPAQPLPQVAPVNAATNSAAPAK